MQTHSDSAFLFFLPLQSTQNKEHPSQPSDTHKYLIIFFIYPVNISSQSVALEPYFPFQFPLFLKLSGRKI